MAEWNDRERLIRERGAPAVSMRWENLAFMHWPVEAEQMRRLVPDGLGIDTYNGRAWLGLVPFRMERTRFRGWPDLPGLGSFYECNVRTYVRRGDKRGVWFFRLDAERLIPVLGGRWLWSLNYLKCRFEVKRSVRESTGQIEHAYSTTHRSQGSASCTWLVGEPIPTSVRGTLAYFLTERYWLFTKRRGRIMGGRIWHEPWSLRDAEIVSLRTEGCLPVGVPGLGDEKPYTLHSDAIDVIGWGLESV